LELLHSIQQAVFEEFVAGFAREAVAVVVLNQNPVDYEKGQELALEALDFKEALLHLDGGEHHSLNVVGKYSIYHLKHLVVGIEKGISDIKGVGDFGEFLSPFLCQYQAAHVDELEPQRRRQLVALMQLELLLFILSVNYRVCAFHVTLRHAQEVLEDFFVNFVLVDQLLVHQLGDFVYQVVALLIHLDFLFVSYSKFLC